MSGKRRKYTPEFREQAARPVIETARPMAHVAAEIGVGEQMLGRWVRLARAADDAGNTGAVLDADERAELERLRRENAELRLDREFLKKAAFFVSEQNRYGVIAEFLGEDSVVGNSLRTEAPTGSGFAPAGVNCVGVTMHGTSAPEQRAVV